jgi:hypothetical protein
MVPVGLRKGSGGEGYYPYSALINSGATFNFISQAAADQLGPEAVRKHKLPTPIAAVNGEPLRATAVIRQMVRMPDSAGAKRGHAINFIIADIAHYDMILGMAWLHKQNPDIHLDTGVWHWHTRTNADDRLIRLVSAGAFVTTMLE